MGRQTQDLQGIGFPYHGLGIHCHRYFELSAHTHGFFLLHLSGTGHP